MNDATVIYKNAAGKQVILQGDDLCFLDVLPLFEFQWTYDLVNSASGMGGAATHFARDPRTINLDLRMRGHNRKEFLQRVNRLQQIAEPDVLENTPGRLYIGDQYMECYLAVGGGVASAPRGGNFATVEINVLAVRPFWCRDVEYTFKVEEENQGTGGAGKKFNLKYAYRYGTGTNRGKIINTHYAPCPMRITVQGPASVPALQIAGNTYRVNASILATEYLVIDQVERKIYKVGQSGEVTNLFNNRDKLNNIFLPAPVGEFTVQYMGSYSVMVTLVEQRSMPEWIA